MMHGQSNIKLSSLVGVIFFYFHSCVPLKGEFKYFKSVQIL